MKSHRRIYSPAILIGVLAFALRPDVALGASKVQATAKAPTVAVTSPLSATAYVAPASITVSASAVSTSGSVRKVAFYGGATLIGTDTTFPYSVVWSSVSSGTYVVSAVATDNHGLSSISSGVSVTVGAAVAQSAPVVALTSPANGSHFTAPSAITLTAQASEAGGSIKNVVLFVAGSDVPKTVIAPPYTATWLNMPAGVYSLYALATDAAGVTTKSATVSITLDTAAAINVAPAVNLSGPLSGSSYVAPATVNLTASASDSDGTVARVDFYAGTTLVGTATAAPFARTWSNAAAGTYAMTAVATDNFGATTRSAAVSITVNNATANVPPTVAITAPAGGTTYVAPATLYLTANAADSDGTVSKVEFYAGATLVGTTTAAPYAGTWSNVAAGTYAMTAVATDNNGATTRSAAVNVTVNSGTFILPPGGTEPLVQASNLVYQGSFRVPGGIHSGGKADAGFEYGGGVIAFNPARDSLYMLGHTWDQFVGEISVPVAIKGSVSSLTTAALLQPLSDPTEGLLPSINPNDPNDKRIGGLLPYQGKLYVAGYSYYDGGMTQVLSHFVTGQDLSVKGDVKGPYQVGTVGAGFVGGYFGLIPPQWEATLGGPVLNGQCCLAIVGRTSSGPASFAIDPTQLGIVNPLPAAPLDYYPQAHPLSSWSSTSTLFNGTTHMGGVVMATGTRSVLFFGRIGVGAFCYGAGTTIQSLDGTLTADGVTHYCYDPLDSGKGTHGYPYIYQVWAYDANDMAKVRSGQLQPWDVRPYATWQLNLPYGTFGSAFYLGAAYDAVTGRIFLSQTQSGADGTRPIVHVFKIQIP